MSSAALVTREQARELADLVERARATLRGRYSANTWRTYRAQWMQFEAWASACGVGACPAAPASVALYLRALGDERLSCSTLDVVLSSISLFHRVQGYRSPCAADVVRDMRAALRRELGAAPRQAVPLLVHDLRGVVDGLGSDLRAVRDRALLLLGWVAALRRSELVSVDVADLRFTGDGIELLIRRSKTDQEARGHLLGVPFARDPSLCPVRAVRAWFEASGLWRGAVFVRLESGRAAPGARLSDRAVARIVKRRASAAGLQISGLSGHSLRAGFVTSAALGGKPEHAIQRQTRHRDRRQLARYIRIADAFRDNAAQGLL